MWGSKGWILFPEFSTIYFFHAERSTLERSVVGSNHQSCTDNFVQTQCNALNLVQTQSAAYKSTLHWSQRKTERSTIRVSH